MSTVNDLAAATSRINLSDEASLEYLTDPEEDGERLSAPLITSHSLRDLEPVMSRWSSKPSHAAQPTSSYAMTHPGGTSKQNPPRAGRPASSAPLRPLAEMPNGSRTSQPLASARSANAAVAMEDPFSHHDGPSRLIADLYIGSQYRPLTPPPSSQPLADPRSPGRDRPSSSASASRLITSHRSSSCYSPSTRCSTANQILSHAHLSDSSTPPRPVPTTPTSGRNRPSTPSQTTTHHVPSTPSSRPIQYPTRLMETPGRSKNKFYVVLVGRRTGVFDDW